MSPAEKQKQSDRVDPLQLNWNDGERQVVVSPEDEDRFVVTCQDAAEACLQSREVLKWSHTFQKVLSFIRNDLDQSIERVMSCFVGPADGHLACFVIAKSSSFDFELAEVLADLEREIATAFPDFTYIRVQQIPRSTDTEILNTFFDPGKTIQIHG